MSNPLAITLHASGAETTTGQGTAVDIGALRRAARLVLDVTAVSGTSPSLEVQLQTSEKGTGGWTLVDTISSIAAEGRREWHVARLAQFVRVVWVITGTTPSFTFTLSGDAHVVYAGPDDLEAHGAPERGWQPLTPSQMAAACIDGSDHIDSFLRNGYVLPLTSWDRSVTINAAKVIARFALDVRGRELNGLDEVTDMAAMAAEKWFRMVGDGKVSPLITDSTPDEYDAGAEMISEPARGWR